MDTCSEALAQLDDVIMHTFQQCVYHLTKVDDTINSLNPHSEYMNNQTNSLFEHKMFLQLLFHHFKFEPAVSSSSIFLSASLSKSKNVHPKHIIKLRGAMIHSVDKCHTPPFDLL